MLTLRNLGKTYQNGARALDGFSLDLAPGEIVAIIGGSGCGKSTLLRLISGLESPTHGTVEINGERVTQPTSLINLIFQEPRLFPWLSVENNVGFGLAELDGDDRRKRVETALQKVGLESFAQRWPKELSGGQAQRVAIARALVTTPEVLLLDEPFSALDAFTRADLQDHLLDIWSEERPTLVVVTHDIDEALILADRIIVMRPSPGRILDEVMISLPRRRDRASPLFETAKRQLLLLLNRSLQPS